jgi:GNAT superfamily N-acetyltransferase
VAHFLARRGARVVGRIAAIENRLHNETHGDRLGFFGFFDVEPDPEAARALVEAARRWVAARGLDGLRGPVNYSTNDSCGVLIDGFDEPPMILMPYNRPDYDALLRGAGLETVKDLVALWIDGRTTVPERFRRVVARSLTRSRVTIRAIDFSDATAEIRRLEDVYNRCWAGNWSYVPATTEEFEHASKQMRPLLEPDLSAVAEIDGEPVGLSLILRDLNRLLPGTNGRLFPRALFRLLFGLKRVSHVRIVALGVVPEARGRGINEAFFLRAIDEAHRKGYAGGEAGWILEDNRKMLAPIERVGGRVTKRYRLYEMPA